MGKLSEIIFGTSKEPEASRLKRLLRSGQARRIASRIYTTNLSDDPEKLIQDNLYDILGRLFPKAVLSHRTALEGKPTADWEVFLTSSYPRTVKLPGVTVRVFQGPGAGKDDMPFLGGLFMSSNARAFLENLQPSRKRGFTPKSISRKELEERLDRTLRLHGDKGINALRDKAREVAKELGFADEFRELDKIIGALLKTQPADDLQSSVGKARAGGEAFDPERMRTFETLFAALKQTPLRETPEAHNRPEALRVLAFFESYFSNHIEGTKFDVEEAREIVFEKKIPETRPKDAHDVLGTYAVVSNAAEMQKLPKDFDQFWTLLSTRHESILNARPETRPGEIKEKPNRTGDTLFVEPELVRGTLARGFDFYRVLEAPSAKAAFMMFLVSEVHPFNDGNGRIARVMMNAELIAAGLRRIVVPPVFRDDYLGGLRALSRNSDPRPHLRMLDRAQEFSVSIDFSDFATARRMLDQANAFKDPGEALLQIPKVA